MALTAPLTSDEIRQVNTPSHHLQVVLDTAIPDLPSPDASLRSTATANFDKVLGAPMLEKALKYFQEDKPQQYKQFEKKWCDITEPKIKDLFDRKLPESKKTSQWSEAAQRMKRWLPSIVSVKGFVMPIAAHDPYKVAPIVCALTFAILEVSY